MLNFLLRRLLSALVLAFVVVTAVFLLLRAFGPDPARAALGGMATPEQVRRQAHILGTDRPLLGQYLSWLGDLVQGDLGTSWANSRQVGDVVGDALPITLSLALGAMTVALVAGFGIGVMAAVRPGVLDRLLQLLVITAFALPGFWVAMILARTFAVDLRWLPATGYTPIGQSPAGWLRSITLPIASLSLGMAASIAQQVRNSVLDITRQDFVRTLRARGLSPRRILGMHVLRNAATPALTVASLQFVAVLSGAVIVEQVFDLHGLGSSLQGASIGGDMPVVMGVVAVAVAAVVAVNLTVDLLLAWLNPKVRETR